MATTADFRNGMTIVMDGDLYNITEFLHVKPGKGGAFVRTKLKNVKTGRVIDRTFRSGEKIEEAKPGDLTFLYHPSYEKYFSSTKATAKASSNYGAYRPECTIH